MPASSERWRPESAPWPTNRLARSRRLAQDKQRDEDEKKGSAPMSAATVPGDTTETLAARAVQVTKVYGQGETEVRALDDVSVEFPSGRFTAIMGPSGSGKSTLMHCLAGLDRITSGQIFIGDVELSKLSEKQLTLLRRDKVGFVFQAFNLLPTLTAAENIDAAPGHRRPQAGPGLGRPGDRRRRAARPPRPPAGRAVRRPAAAGGRGPGAGQPSRRSSSPTSPPATSTRRPGAEMLGFLRRAVDELRPDHRDGHPRPERRPPLRRPGAVPGRRPHRRRDGRPDRRAGARPHEEASGG